MVAALVLVIAGTPIARTSEARSRQNVLNFYDGLKPGQEQDAIQRRIRETENFSFSPLNLDEHDRLAGFPADTDVKPSMIVESHGTWARVALWFRPSPDGEKFTLAREPFSTTSRTTLSHLRSPTGKIACLLGCWRGPS